jgi:1-deoxy-D-xylulose-5-phosphate synthase
MVSEARRAAELLDARGVRTTVVNARFANPVDVELLSELSAEQPFLVTLEDASLAGGFGSAVMEALHDSGARPVRVKRMGIPAELCDHSARPDTMERLGLTPEGVADTVEQMLHEKTSRPAW